MIVDKKVPKIWMCWVISSGKGAPTFFFWGGIMKFDHESMGILINQRVFNRIYTGFYWVFVVAHRGSTIVDNPFV